ncbi:cytochrome c oxidase subunit II, putative [Eimeria necatrix]|uniref:Cytochrome c oxidase polypeptide II n=1 Tax=Eimeria necatrix TaxID=51315 RepID=U6N4X7_9EIME|nr:cytochrome c oxidase subunit II, putative [Eimeria necatrix]CDJ70349.1 cytochrome c oxidase subunit II, putative [Eimeria necatrix]
MLERMRSWFSGSKDDRSGLLLPSLTHGGASPALCRSAEVSAAPAAAAAAAAESEVVRPITDAAAAAKSAPAMQNVSAADYPTPAKYLENPDLIPTYYTFQSNMVSDEDLLPGMLRNLEVDRRLTLPTRTHIRFLVTATDVIHSWAVPALGIKADAIPGRLQKVNTFIQREGVFYGQCSELCGALHGFMPIVVEAVSPETYAAHARKWYKE